jgi:O-antigen/teichoic acid export membrane protein
MLNYLLQLRALIGRKKFSNVNLNFLLLFGSNIYIKVTALLTLPLLVKSLTVEKFGVYSVALNLLGYYVSVFAGGIKKVATIETKGGLCNHGMLARYSTLRVLLLVAGWVLSCVFCLYYFQGEGQVYSLAIVSSGLFYTFNTAWLKEISGDMGLISGSLVVERSVFVVVSVYGVISELNYFIFLAIPISILFGSIYTKFKHPALLFHGWLIKVDDWLVIKKSMTIGLSFLVSTLNLTIDQLIVGIMFSERDLGMYAGVSRLYIAFLTFGWMFSQIYSPQVSKIISNFNETRCLIRKSLFRLALAGFGVALGSILFSSQIINIVLTPDYQQVEDVYLILAPMIVLAFCNVVICDSMDVYGFGGARFKILISAIILNLLLSLGFGILYGLIGIAMASVASQAFIFVASYFVINKKYSINMRWLSAALPLASILYSGIVFYG